MEWTLGTNVVFISFLYLSLIVTSSALVKCGKYKHACYGGNGKRSDPSFGLSPSSSAGPSINLRHPSLLSKILISDDDGLSEKVLVPGDAWSGSNQGYISPSDPQPYDVEALLRSIDTDDKTEDRTCRGKMQLALLEIVELRKYIAILEAMVRVSSPDVE